MIPSVLQQRDLQALEVESINHVELDKINDIKEVKETTTLSIVNNDEILKPAINTGEISKPNKKYKKKCEFCDEELYSQAYVRHLKCKKHQLNQKLYYDLIKFQKVSSRDFDEFVDIEKHDFLVSNTELKLHVNRETRYVLKTKTDKIILDRCEGTGSKNLYIGIRYLIKNNQDYIIQYKTKDNIIGKEVYYIDLLNKTITLSNYVIA